MRNANCQKLAWAALAIVATFRSGPLAGDASRADEVRPASEQIHVDQPEAIPGPSAEWLRPLEQIEVVNLVPAGRLPPDVSEGVFAEITSPEDQISRQGWTKKQLLWAASEMAHQPLYFDDVPLERYGQTCHPLVQPLVSGALFFGTFPVMPYKIGLDHPYDLISTLGYYRPGSPAPCMHQTLPFEWDAATLEAGAWAGLVLLLP
jgi:hypothetical protein